MKEQNARRQIWMRVSKATAGVRPAFGPLKSAEQTEFPFSLPSWPPHHRSDQPFASHEDARFCVQSSPSSTKADILIPGLHATSVSRAITKFKMPAMSPTMTEGGIASWKKREGDSFTAGDVLLEIVCHERPRLAVEYLR